MTRPAHDHESYPSAVVSVIWRTARRLSPVVVTPRCVALGVALAFAATVAPAAARADRMPKVASDAFYLGARFAPGVALTAGWDLDIYLTRSRAVSMGPGVFLSILGAGERAGMEQDLLVSADALRLKVQVNESGDDWRPYLMVGVGFSYARLPEQAVTGVAISTEGGGEVLTTGTQNLPSVEEYAPMLTVGFGGDFFAGGAWATSMLLQSHVHLSGSERIPELWMELALGIRFGI